MDMQDQLDDLKSRMNDLDAKIAGLIGTPLEPIGPDDMAQSPTPESILTDGPPPGMSPSDWLSTGINGSGFITDPGLARSTPCLRLELGPSYRPLVFSDGISGALDEEQEQLYCQEGYETRQASERQIARIEALREAAPICGAETHGETVKDHIADFYSCLGKELRSRGIEP